LRHQLSKSEIDRRLREGRIPMLNDYHLQLLGLFNNRKVRFLVIGGQARWAHFGTPTRDLDLWVDISPKNRPALDQCLVDWKARYPIHTLMDISQPLALRPKVQIKFPDADAWFERRDGEFAEILVQDGIDILTSVNDADFDFYFERAATKIIDRLDIPFLAARDIEVISPPGPIVGLTSYRSGLPPK
jgi:hypothetical protein